jgi:hypothetical protein
MQVTFDNGKKYDFAVGDTRHWLIPPHLYSELDAEFHFDYDPCPYPKPLGFNSLTEEWGNSVFLNPPFHREGKIGPTAFVRKAIKEHQKGKTIVLTLPVQSYVNLLLEAGAELRSLGRVQWLEVETKKPMKGPSPICCFVLKHKEEENE